MKLSTRLMAGMASVVLFAVAAVGTFAYWQLSRTIVPAELRILGSRVGLLASQLTSHIKSVREDVLSARLQPALRDVVEAAGKAPAGILTEAPDKATSPETADPENPSPLPNASDGVARSNAPSAERWEIARQRLAGYFLSQMTVRSEILQFRLIGAADGGREIVRVERSRPGAKVEIVEDARLQQKGDREYFTETIGLPEGALYVSPIDLNQEFGYIQTPYVPVLRMATAVHTAEGQPFGVVIVNVSMGQVLESVRKGGRDDDFVYVINGQGDYLVHPERDREFGFNLGQRHRLIEDFPDLVKFVAHSEPAALMAAQADGAKSAVGLSPVVLDGGLPLLVIETTPYKSISQPIGAIWRATLLAGAVCTAIALLFALWLARSVARPLEAMTRAVRAYGPGSKHKLPLAAHGEAGELARAFQSMTESIFQKGEELKIEMAERGRAENEALRYAEKAHLHTAFVKSADDAILTVGLDGSITGWNPASEQLFGYAAEEAIGRHVRMIAPTDRFEEPETLLQRVLQGESIVRLETRRRAKSGKNIEVLLSVAPIHSNSGAIEGASAVLRDMTEARAADERFRLAVEASPSGMAIVDRHGVITMANMQLKRMFGYEKGELLGKAIELLAPERHRAAHARNRERFQRDPTVAGAGAARELFGLRKNGVEFPVEVALSEIHSKGEDAVLVVLLDITQRKAMEAAIMERAEQLERSNRELDSFAYVASHDLKAPLRAIDNLSQWIEEDVQGSLSPETAEHMTMLRGRVRRMEGLLDALLEYSRLGRLEGKNSDVDTEEVVRGIWEMIAPPPTMLLSIPAPLPSFCTLGAPFELVLRNLIQNALKHHDKMEGTITVTCADARDFYAFTVRDDGPGIAREFHEKIFEMFRTLRPRDEVEGSGMGLALIKKTVELYGGVVEVESNQGQGAAFRFTWPKSIQRGQE